MKTIRLILICLFAVVVVPQTHRSQATAQDSDELLLFNGKVYTLDEDQPWAEAILVNGSRIVAVGSNEEVSKQASETARRLDLGGRLTLPGFIDTHVHLASAARFYEFNLMTTSSQDDFVERISKLVEQLEEGDWITGGLWGAYDQWEQGSTGSETRKQPFAPDMRLVESFSQNHPIFLRKFDNSEYAANTSALKRAGIDPVNPEETDGVEFILEDGEFTGRMRGPSVAQLFRGIVPSEVSYDRRIAQTKRVMRMAASHGVTTVSDMSDDQQLAIYYDLRERDELTLRIDFRYTLDRWQEVADKGIRIGHGDEWIRLGSLKGFIDGIMGTSSARFFEPYDHNPDSRGRWREMMRNEKGEVDFYHFFDMMAGADKAGLQITIHAIGDEANHVLMNFLEELDKQNGKRDRRFRLVHAQVIADDDFARLSELGIIAEVQPFHLSDDMRWMEERIGSKRCEGAYAFRRIAESGARLCFGSDWPGTSAAEYPINPMLAIYAAVTRQTVNGTPEEGWYPNQRLDLERALKAHTVDAAYALFEEDRKGSIEVGKLADITVLAQDLFETEPSKWLETETELTMVGGRVVYERDPSEN